MNLNPEQFPTYKFLFPVQTTQTTAPITMWWLPETSKMKEQEQSILGNLWKMEAVG